MQKSFGVIFILVLCFSFGVQRAEGRWTEDAVGGEEAARIRQAATDLILKEVEGAGSFEVDDPESGDLLKLSFKKIEETVVRTSENEYLVTGEFTDEAGALQKVDLFLRELEGGSFELVDAVLIPDYSRLKFGTL